MGWFRSSSKHGNFERMDGEPLEFDWNIFPGFNTLQLSEEVKSLLYRLGETSENFTCSMTFLVDQKTTKKNAWQMPNSCLCTQKDFEKDNGHLLVLVLKRSGTVSVKTVQKEYGTTSPKECWWNSQKADVQFSVLRAHCPEVNSKAKDTENCRQSIHYAADLETVETIFRIIVSANQLSLFGAVAEICEEYESLQVRPVVMGQSSSSFVLSVIKTEVPLDCDDLVNQDLLLQQYGERIERLPQQDKLSKLCMDAGFLNVVEIGTILQDEKTLQISHNFMQWPVVNILFQEKKKHHNRKDGSKGTQRLGPY